MIARLARFICSLTDLRHSAYPPSGYVIMTAAVVGDLHFFLFSFPSGVCPGGLLLHLAVRFPFVLPYFAERRWRGVVLPLDLISFFSTFRLFSPAAHDHCPRNVFLRCGRCLTGCVGLGGDPGSPDLFCPQCPTRMREGLRVPMSCPRFYSSSSPSWFVSSRLKTWIGLFHRWSQSARFPFLDRVPFSFWG